MAARRKLLKLIGPVAWAEVDLRFRSQVSRAILRDGSQLVVDLEYGGWRYSVSLKRESGDQFRGSWSSEDGGRLYTGSASARLYTSDGGCLLFGDWFEGSDRYHWWAELSSVEHFPDEAQG
jgi:hypothetical protein